MTRTRKVTLTVKEFSHLVSESLDIALVAPSPQSLVNTSVFSEPPKPHIRPSPSSFHRIFSRPPPMPGRYEPPPEETPEDVLEMPRKTIGWPFSRSPRKNPPTEDEDDTADVRCVSPYLVTSPAAASTSSLGSLVPAHERLFQLASRDSDESSRNSALFRMADSSSGAISPHPANETPPDSGRYAVSNPSHSIPNGSAIRVCASSNQCMVKPASSIPEGSRSPGEGTSLCAANSETESLGEGPTARTSTFGPWATLPPEFRKDRSPPPRGRTQCSFLIMPSQDMDVLALRAIHSVTPSIPSETESSASTCSASSQTFSVTQDSSVAIRPSSGSGISPRVSPSSPNSSSHAVFPVSSSTNLEPPPALAFSPRQRKRALSRSMTPPPLPRPPPTGPLPAVPSSVPPVPPLPPLLHKLAPSPPRSTIPGAPTNSVTALTSSPPGTLRLPSRLSWVNNVRAVLPSPPASPARGKTPLPISPSRAEKTKRNELKRPTSIGVIEAADNVQVRRTKSILLLGSRSKSNASLATKRVQIHADVDLDAATPHKARRKSSAATVSHPILACDFAAGVTAMPSSEILVPRERRHSAPLLSSCMDSNVPDTDWTLSLPFCTDVPGNKILPSPLLTPQLKSERTLPDEDWTLCMPLKVHVDTSTVEVSEGCDGESVRAETSETLEPEVATQLPTPGPSPTRSTPSSVVLPLEPGGCMPIPVNRPASPASLGPDLGGLDLAGGRGKRASGWHVYGWFDDVSSPVDKSRAVAQTATPILDNKVVKSHVTVFRKAHDTGGRHPSQESVSTVSTCETMFYSARSSLLVN